jgi:hypothetical protein
LVIILVPVEKQKKDQSYHFGHKDNILPHSMRLMSNCCTPFIMSHRKPLVAGTPYREGTMRAVGVPRTGLGIAPNDTGGGPSALTTWTVTFAEPTGT